MQMATKLSEMQKIAPAEAKQYLSLPFNKQHEVDRKRQAELMDNRTKEQACDCARVVLAFANIVFMCVYADNCYVQVCAFT